MRTKLLLTVFVLLLTISIGSAAVTVQKSTDGTTIQIFESGKQVSTIPVAHVTYTLVDNYLYLAGEGFYIYDLSNPKKPDRVYSLEWSGTSVDTIYSMYADRNIAVISYEDSMTILDVSEPEYTTPLSYTWIEAPLISITKSGNTLKTSLCNWDISDPSNPVRVTNMDIETVASYNKGVWSVLTDNGFHKETFGTSADIPVAGDWDGFYSKNMGLYNSKTGDFTIRYYDGESKVFSMPKNCIPVSGDWNGLYMDQVGTYNPKTGIWTLSKYYGDEVEDVYFGWDNCIPLVGDWNGDGIEDIGVYNDNGDNFVLKTGDQYEIIGLGWDGVIPVIGDWDGDGKDDVGVYSKDTWVLETPLKGTYDFVGFGWGSVKPITGNWNKDMKTDIGVYNPENGMFVLNDNGVKMYTTDKGTPIS